MNDPKVLEALARLDDNLHFARFVEHLRSVRDSATQEAIYTTEDVDGARGTARALDMLVKQIEQAPAKFRQLQQEKT